MGSVSFKLRAVQLDLARQMETTGFIRSFIDFAAENGFNAVVLYLEGRIRTENFLYPTADKSYSPDEMREIVSYAESKGMDIIPATQALAHAEQFLNFKETFHLSELRNSNRKGRWTAQTPVNETFCPSLPETKDFIEGYFTELAEIFPSKYFNAGLDEAWHIGICELCRKHPGGQQGIFTEHIKWLHSLINGKLGKRMMLWDDMFQHYPETLKDIPKDIVLCCWHYEAPTDELRWHFGDRSRIDKLTEFSRLGFECCIAPADFTLMNVETFTEYASGRQCLGGILTTWEKSLNFYHESYPIIAFSGHLWRGMTPENAINRAVKSLFGIDEPVFINAIRTAKNIHLRLFNSWNRPENFLRGQLKYEQLFAENVSEMLLATLAPYLNKAPNENARLSLENILLKLKYSCLFMKLRKLIPQIYDPQIKDVSAQIEELKAVTEEIRKYVSEISSFWNKVRPGIPNAGIKAHFSVLIDNLLQLPSLHKKGLMSLTLFSTGITQDSEVLVKFDDSPEWEKIVSTRLTPETCDPACDPYHTRSFQFPADRTPVSLRFETWGYGTQGIAFVKIFNAKGIFVPDALISVKGIVLEPHNILHDSIYYALAGGKYDRDKFNNHKSGHNTTRHGFEITLKNVKEKNSPCGLDYIQMQSVSS